MVPNTPLDSAPGKEPHPPYIEHASDARSPIKERWGVNRKRKVKSHIIIKNEC